MKYKLIDLIDISQFQKLMETFYNISKVPHGLLDPDGNVLSGIGWQDICTKFHRVNSKSAYNCTKSDLSMKTMVNKKEKYTIYQCQNGLIESTIPIVIEGEHIANLILGQFFYHKPDLKYFRKQAEEFGFDVDAYLKALSLVPIISKEQLKSYMAYYLQIADMLTNIILKELKQRETESLLLRHNANLENMVAERTEKLKKINVALEKDILERKHIEKSLKESEERYRLLIELFPYGICVRNKDTILFANRTSANYLGFEHPKKVIGKKLTELFIPHPDYREVFYENMENIEKTGSLSLTEEKFIRILDKKILYVETVSSFIPYDNNREILVVFKDISERKRLEELQKKVAEKEKLLRETIELEQLRSDFFANLSHEIKTPINLIFSTIQLLELEIEIENKVISQDINVKKRMHVLKQNCNRLIKLTNNLIDITKIDSGYLKLHLQNCNIVDIIEDLTLSVADYIKNKNISLLFDTDTEEKIMRIDPYAVERIILNLLSNAVKFSKPDSKIIVNITSSKKEVIISVKDTGIGIPKEKLQLIFDRFRQVDKSLTRNHEGSGMGLSITKSLVLMHGGAIIAKSEYGKGSEFIVTLPAKPLSTKKNIVNSYVQNTYTEVIAIEFSDIYSS
ncbi:PocR ligand-binding domain-containing protein [Marinisporobacter balticus]|uniref:histidine kinase n=1 Tax=Marinisporobacter balticus TaxID=2018667 RepID=A0A4R2L7K2_9FIRM|nr:PocR ligand-binding domain-containing protein [Marinisporobacter balticus]TCO78658.1 PAS domain S-box-containing protein [Marinisporobacter balticus]